MEKLHEYGRSVWASLKIIARFHPRLLWAVSLKGLLKSGYPFILIIVTSQAITLLAEKAPVRQTIVYTLAGIACSFMVLAIRALLDKYCTVRLEDCWRRFEGLTGEKTLSIDYPQLDSPKTTALRQKMKDDANWGAGIRSVYWAFESLTECAFTLILSITVVLPLLQALSTQSDLLIAACFGFSLLCLIGLSVFLSHRAGKKEQEAMNNLTKDNHLFMFFVQGMDYAVGKDIRIYRAQALIEKVGHQFSMAAAQYFFKSNTRHSGAATGIGAAITTLIQGGAYLFVALGAAAGMLPIGMVVRCAGSIFQFSTALSNLLGRISNLVVSAERQRSTLQFFDIPDVLYKGTLTTEKREDNDYEIAFDHVSFRYPGAEQYALRDLSLKLHVGERLAVVGMNGSGKTTMIKLLCRLYDPSEGKITLNGIDIRKYDYAEYLELLSVVFQDFKLFSLPLGQNIAASTQYDSQKALTCLEKAGFGERIKALSRGLETCLYKDFDEDGVEISGGEAQKIALARALYKDAPFIILDEPTAALDPIAEYEIYSKFDGIVGGRTAIYISHRLSSCRFCHDIAVFHEGALVQRGSHDELVADRSGKYFELWHAQAQYYAHADDAPA